MNNPKRLLLLVVLVLAAVLLAFPLQSAGQAVIILPLAKLLFFLKGYYRAFPQMSYWLIALGVAVVILIASLPLPDLGRNRSGRSAATAQGAVQDLAFWLQRARTGVYPRWHLARLLADLALGALHLRSPGAGAGRRLEGPDWDPPPSVQEYLQAALTTSHSEYSMRRHAGLLPSTPFDQGLEPAIDYLEHYLEVEHEHHDS